MIASIKSWADWCRKSVDDTVDNLHRRFLLYARTACGHDTLEEQLIRLMVWTGAVLSHTNKHSLIKNPLNILAEGTAWCDQQCIVFGFLAMHILECESARNVAIYHSDGVQGHTISEVKYNSSWHMFNVDQMHCFVPRDTDGHILSYDETRKVLDKLPAIRDHWWNGGADSAGVEGFYTDLAKPHIVDIAEHLVWPWPSLDKPVSADPESE